MIDPTKKKQPGDPVEPPFLDRTIGSVIGSGLANAGNVVGQIGSGLAKAAPVARQIGRLAIEANAPIAMAGMQALSTPPNVLPLPTPTTPSAPLPRSPADAAAPAPLIATAVSPSFQAANAGVTGTAVRPMVSDAGRALGYGNTGSNGVRSFDNTDLATINARAAGLGRADPGIGGGIGTEAAGGTPTLGAFNGRTDTGAGISTRPDPMAAARGNNIQTQRAAAADAAAIVNRDTRSPLGLAAYNASIEAGSTPTSRKLAYENALGALNGVAGSGIKPQADLGVTDVQDAGATRRAGIAADASIVGDLARNRPTPGAQVPMADGSLGLLGPDGVVRAAKDAKGQPVKTLQTKDDSAAKRSAEIQDSIAKVTAALLADRVKPGDSATPQQVAQARETAALQHGLPIRVGKDGKRYTNINGEVVTL